MRLELRLGQRCATCGELKSAEKQTDDITSAALFGVTGNPYTICPGCMQETPMDVRNDPGVPPHGSRHPLHQIRTGGSRMKRVYTHYSDGQTWIDEFHSDTWIEIPVWQWKLYTLYRWVSRKLDRWLTNLDNQAYEAWEKRTGRTFAAEARAAIEAAQKPASKPN